VLLRPSSLVTPLEDWVVGTYHGVGVH